MPFRASTRKRHILVDTLGLIMVREGAKLIFKAFTGSCKNMRRIWVDGGNPLIGMVAKRFHIVLQTILRSDDVNYFHVAGSLKEHSLDYNTVIAV